jgi:hypothetical protein
MIRTEQAKERHRKRQREQMRAKRRAAGVRPLEESFTRTRPWAALGICERTWRRRGLHRPDQKASEPQSASSTTTPDCDNDGEIGTKVVTAQAALAMCRECRWRRGRV